MDAHNQSEIYDLESSYHGLSNDYESSLGVHGKFKQKIIQVCGSGFDMNSHQPDAKQVLSKALLNAAEVMGLTQLDIAAVIGLDHSVLYQGISPDSKAGELAKLFIRCYRSLYVLVGGDQEQMAHWMHTYNKQTQGIPADQIKKDIGLSCVLDYLNAIRGTD